ncbi:DUF2187 domain-containing protein [Oceanobacillus piezotolerans]|uniref:DUF2187 domain-containing protein n=1 Tax=Oceanobacillus piezotolerans TaxID=2448030 RepID=A0A498DAJ4_9BACI|nr:DUF2187 domain-containing protein [Oceanobacillus piezotolerans]
MQELVMKFSFKPEIKSIVEKIYENSVIVSVTENTTNSEFEGVRQSLDIKITLMAIV